MFDDKIRVGVAVWFLVRKRGADGFRAFYNAVPDYAKAPDKVEYVKDRSLDDLDFAEITPDRRHSWLNHGNPDFPNLLPLADRETRSAKSEDGERAVFHLFSNGVKTNRDEWVYDFAPANLRDKVRLFINTYNGELDSESESYNRSIKWSSTLRNRYERGERLIYDGSKEIQSLLRPFVTKYHFADRGLNDILTKNHYEMFGSDLQQPNSVICFSGVASSKPFQTLAVNRLPGLDFLEKTQCLPLYRYAENGERVCNVTDWAIRRINDHYRKEFRRSFGELFGDGITAEDIFAYTYAVLHDPVYRYDYANDLLREFPRLPLYHDFDIWARMGNRLLDLHLNFETADPYPLERRDKPAPSPSANGGGDALPPRPRLKADKERGIIVIDDRTSLHGIPEDAWRYELGNRSALEWVLDQHKEKKPRDPTIRARFDNYRLSDRKERLVDLLAKICAISVQTMEIVDDMAYWDEGSLIVFGDRDKHEWGMLGLSQWFSEPEDEEWLAQWLEM